MRLFILTNRFVCVGFHLGFSSKGEGKCDNCRVKGDKEYSSTFIHDFSLEKDIIVLTRGGLGHAPPGKFLKLSTSETVSGGI